jgi:RHS repeat-associated core domain
MKTAMQAMRALLLLGLWLGWMQAVHAQTDTVTYVYTDPQGTPLVKADASGNVIARYDYTPYGSSVASLGNPPDGPGYTGHVNDPETGLVYMQARYYQPFGRFLSPDPVEPSPGNLFSFNRYAYANNNPITNVDPDGRSVTCDQNSCTIVAHNLLEAMAGYAYVGGVIIQRTIQNTITHSSQSPTNENSPALPGGLVGVQDGKSGQRGKRINSGPLAPEHGGTGDSEKDFGKLTGGESHPAPIGQYAPGTTVGDNGIAHRPATEDSGPRIDIPANGDKPHETLHYPKPSPPPPPPNKDPSQD